MKFKLTNCLSGIRNAWHFQHAVSFAVKLVCGSFVVHCSPLSRALVAKSKSAANSQNLKVKIQS
ncbi:DUF3265 domain-containing protein [Vibrio vulnificus]